ncbi:hypothetical protein CQA62_04055 [Helicobacter cholecystus]|uniref:Uncharacterized protein n=1 Tax=Helicobacter cholecystus TaxID=45498 RepID=A0A3D8IUQ6_9HELI|nr:hypothetical protein [Helicobacter cholecystus]RDU69019.1 hypothetical protein CQA62_04055 [Helicobacter cholecystus]VEJ24545.1 putative NADH dehydrogenase subunit F [Helicobacter cholecystus]
MECLFEIKKAQKIKNRKIILGYAPHLIDENSLVFSPLGVACDYQINYEVGSEEGVAMLLAHTLSPGIFNNLKDFDMGYLSAESNVGEEELEEVLNFIANESFCVILTQDFLAHPLGYKILSLLSTSSLLAHYPLFLQDQPLSYCQPLGESNGMIARITQAQSCELRGSSQFALFSKLQHLEKITLKAQDLQTQTTFILDESMKGVIALLKISTPYPHYPYQKIQILK